MAQPSLDDRILSLQADLNPDTPQAPISTDNTSGAGPARVFIYPNQQPQAGATTGSGSLDAAPAMPSEPIAAPDGAIGGAPTASTDTGGNALPQPTPVDNTPQLIEQKRQQALEALKGEGFDGYTPDVTGAKDFTPDEQASLGTAVQDIGAGFNISLARTLSLPRETVDRALGLLGLDYMQYGGPQQMTIDAMNRMGVPSYEVENLANKIGKGALPALATFAAMQLAAPSMAANGLVNSTGLKGATGYVMQNMGQWALKHPVVGLWLGQSAQAGGKTAMHATGSENPLVELGGELAGGIAPGLAKGMAKLPLKLIPGAQPALNAAGTAIGKGVNALADNLPTDLSNAIKKYNPFYQQKGPNIPKESLIDPNMDANRLQTFAKDQVYGAQTYQDKAVENAINSIPTSGTSAQIQNRTHNLLQDAEKISKNIVSGFWRRVPLKTKIPVNDLAQDVRAIKADLVDSDNIRPDAMIGKILEVTTPTRLPNGQMAPARPTIRKLRDLQSQIGTAITEERARDAPREGQVFNLVRLSEAIDDNIARQMPNNTSIAQAREMSKRHNDLFSRGPINDILSKRRTGDFRVPQGDSIDALMQKTGGLQALKNVQEGVSSYPRVPSTKFRPASVMANPFAVTPAEKQTLDDMIASASDAIRTAFRDASEQSPQKGVAYSAKNHDEITALGKVAGELQFAASKVAASLAESKAIKASALARFAETTPDAAVKNIFAQRDPAGVARQLMLSFRGDPDALEGLRNQILNEFVYNRGRTNPNIMQKMMNEPRIGNLLEATLHPDQLVRLRRMVETAVKVGVEDETGIKEAFRSPVKLAGRVLGAAIGRRVSNTLQGPAIFSKATGAWAERTLGGTDPSDLLAQAVLDPHWEHLLYSRIPTTTRDMKAAEVIYRRIFAATNSAQQAVLNKLSKDEGRDAE